MPKTLSDIKLVIFDVNETMFSLDSIATKFETLGLPNLSASLWFSNILKEGFANSSIGNFQTFKKIANNELKRIFLKFKINYHNRYSSIIFDEFSKLKAHKDIIDSIRLLANKKLKMVTLTNGSKDNTLKLLKNSGLQSYISRCFSINELRTWKPDKKTYIYVCKEMNVPPSKTLMIAAHAWDVNGAKKAGLKTGYITRYEKVLSEIYTEPDLVDNNCFSIIKRIKFN